MKGMGEEKVERREEGEGEKSPERGEAAALGECVDEWQRVTAASP